MSYDPVKYRQYYLANREKRLQLAKDYVSRNREKHLQYSRMYHALHKDKAARSSRLWRAQHKHHIFISSQKYYQINRLKILEKKKQYHKEHPECSIATRENYRRRAKQAGKLTVKLVQQVYEANIHKFGTLTCYLCGKPIIFGDDSLEHKIPLSRGGTNTASNLDIAHCSCNARKNNKTEIEYREVTQCLS